MPSASTASWSERPSVTIVFGSLSIVVLPYL